MVGKRYTSRRANSNLTALPNFQMIESLETHFLAALLQCGGVNSAVDALEIFRQCAQAHDVIIRRGER